jgi:hypothetical protein
MFHFRDGVFFERLGDGSVRLLVKESSHDDAKVLKDIAIDIDSWCSIIACMSYYGEEDYGFFRACNFHYKRPIHETEPLKDKEPPPNFKGL